MGLHKKVFALFLFRQLQCPLVRLHDHAKAETGQSRSHTSLFASIPHKSLIYLGLATCRPSTNKQREELNPVWEKDIYNGCEMGVRTQGAKGGMNDINNLVRNLCALTCFKGEEDKCDYT